MQPQASLNVHFFKGAFRMALWKYLISSKGGIMMSDTQAHWQAHWNDIRMVLDRAHAAAMSAKGTELRHALEEGRDLLQGPMPEAAKKLSQALVDFDRGALVEMESLLECVRRSLPQIE
jgi:hypothetical protein